MAKRIVACDLDGTLAIYKGERDHMFIGEPIKCMVDAIKVIRECNGEVWIFTARLSDPQTHDVAKKVIEDWLKKHDIQVDGITCVKQKFFSEFWDDRAIQVIKNTGEFIMYSDGTHMSGLSGHDHMAIAAETWYDHKTRVKSFPHSLKNEPAFTPVNSALDIQEGGDHYKKYKIQPIEFVVANNIPVLEANAQKYILRHADKNGMGDLRKARHYLELMAEMYYGEKL